MEFKKSNLLYFLLFLLVIILLIFFIDNLESKFSADGEKKSDFVGRTFGDIVPDPGTDNQLKLPIS